MIIEEKICDMMQVFRDKNLSKETRENALKALLFLYKYECDKSGDSLRTALIILKRDYISKTPMEDKVATNLVHIWLINYPRQNELRLPEEYNRPKSIDEPTLLVIAQQSIQHEVRANDRINAAFPYLNDSSLCHYPVSL